jgi:protein SCO1
LNPVRSGQSIRRALLALVVSSTFAALLAACDRKTSEERRYELKGTVVEVDREHGELGVAHEAIPGFMDAMTMSFSVAEWVLAAAAPGDTISAELVVSEGHTRLEKVSLSKAPSPNDPDPENIVEGAAPGEPIPDLTFVNQSGKNVRLRDADGVLVVTFIFTRCPLPDYCPLMNQRFVELDSALASEPGLARKVSLLSVTLDPAYDTPAVLDTYSRPYRERDLSVRRWDFVTAEPERIEELAGYFGLLYRSEGDQIVHSLRTAVVGPSGTLFRVFRGNGWKADDLRDAIRDAMRKTGVGDTVPSSPIPVSQDELAWVKNSEVVKRDDYQSR